MTKTMDEQLSRSNFLQVPVALMTVENSWLLRLLLFVMGSSVKAEMVAAT